MAYEESQAVCFRRSGGCVTAQRERGMMTMRGTCDFCDQPATERCHEPNCMKQMCNQHAHRMRDMGTQSLGTLKEPYLVFYTYCMDHAKDESNER